MLMSCTLPRRNRSLAGDENRAAGPDRGGRSVRRVVSWGPQSVARCLRLFRRPNSYRDRDGDDDGTEITGDRSCRKTNLHI